MNVQETGQLDAQRTALWNMCQENYTQGRHHETQRSAVSSAMIAIATGIIGLVTFDRRLSFTDLPLTLLLTVLGLFGLGFSLKQYERWRLHMERAKKYRNKLDELLADHPLKALKRQADLAHNQKFKRMSKIRLHWLWGTLNLFIAGLGLILTILALTAAG
jgi:hypothetical protein